MTIEMSWDKDPVDTNTGAGELAEMSSEDSVHLRNARVSGAGAKSDDWRAVACDDCSSGWLPL